MKSSVPKTRQMPPAPAPKGEPGNNPNQSKKPANENGRPKLQKDTKPRKARQAKPKSKPGVAELLMWSEAAWNDTSDIMNKVFLGSKNKKNLRQLTKVEAKQLQQLKLDVFTNLETLGETDEKVVANILSSGQRTPQDFRHILSQNGISPDTMSVDSYRRGVIGAYIEQKMA